MIGNVLGLDYATVGAVIAILSIQDTRRQALIVGKKRVVACLIGILISIISVSYTHLFFILGQIIPVFVGIKILLGLFSFIS